MYRTYHSLSGTSFGCDEQKFIDILCKANAETCAAVREAYDRLPQSSKTLEAAVESEMGGDLEFAVLARVRSKTEFLAQRIYKACKASGSEFNSYWPRQCCNCHHLSIALISFNPTF